MALALRSRDILIAAVVVAILIAYWLVRYDSTTASGSAVQPASIEQPSDEVDESLGAVVVPTVPSDRVRADGTEPVAEDTAGHDTKPDVESTENLQDPVRSALDSQYTNFKADLERSPQAAATNGLAVVSMSIMVQLDSEGRFEEVLADQGVRLRSDVPGEQKITRGNRVYRVRETEFPEYQGLKVLAVGSRSRRQSSSGVPEVPTAERVVIPQSLIDSVEFRYARAVELLGNGQGR